MKATRGDDEVIIAGDNGKAVRFDEKEIRMMGRTASGVQGFNTDGGTVIGVALSHEGDTVLVVSENGYGKRSQFDDFRLTSRGKKASERSTLRRRPAAWFRFRRSKATRTR